MPPPTRSVPKLRRPRTSPGASGGGDDGGFDGWEAADGGAHGKTWAGPRKQLRFSSPDKGGAEK